MRLQTNFWRVMIQRRLLGLNLHPWFPRWRKSKMQWRLGNNEKLSNELAHKSCIWYKQDERLLLTKYFWVGLKDIFYKIRISPMRLLMNSRYFFDTSWDNDNFREIWIFRRFPMNPTRCWHQHLNPTAHPLSTQVSTLNGSPRRTDSSAEFCLWKVN